MSRKLLSGEEIERLFPAPQSTPAEVKHMDLLECARDALSTGDMTYEQAERFVAARSGLRIPPPLPATETQPTKTEP